MEEQLRSLSIDADEGFEFPKLRENQTAPDYSLCLVGTFLTDRPINFLIMKHRMASLWRPGSGLFIKDLGSKLILFRFYHHHDLRWVMDGGPWTFDNHLLVLHVLDAPLHSVPFWIQIHDLPACFFH